MHFQQWLVRLGKLLLLPCGVAMVSGGSARAVDEESWNAKFQTTYNWQKHPGFSAAYSGANFCTSSELALCKDADYQL